ncbi:MAG: hypothetical protein JXQ99_27925 [Hyphomicrobiaceae bacterium]
MPLPNLLLGQLSPGADRSAATRAVKDMVRKNFDLDEGATVFVAEVSCGEIDCPDVETVIAVFLDDVRQELKIAKPVDAITGADIAEAVAT